MLLTGDGIARSAVVHPHIPVPQGKRGVLRDWLGSLVNFVTVRQHRAVHQDGLAYSRAGGEQ